MSNIPYINCEDREPVRGARGMIELLTVKEVAALLKTSRVQVRKMIRNGELAAVHVGREYRIPLVEFEVFIEESLLE